MPATKTKLISWNVNGIRAILRKGELGKLITKEKPKILCLQETKARPEQVEIPPILEEYQSYWNSAEKAGYSGVAIFSKETPLEIQLGIGKKEHDNEGRVIALEYPKYFLINVYTPNSQDGLKRLPYRIEWDKSFLSYVKKLEKQKPIIFCGDLNVAHQEIDLARPKDNRLNPGFSDEERVGFDNILKNKFIDTYRYFYPKKTEAYSWWSYRMRAREKNIGWRIDYFCVSQSLKKQIKSAQILEQVMGSDHCPVCLEISLS